MTDQIDTRSLRQRVKHAEQVEEKLIDKIRKLGVRAQEKLLEQLRETEPIDD